MTQRYSRKPMTNNLDLGDGEMALLSILVDVACQHLDEVEEIRKLRKIAKKNYDSLSEKITLSKAKRYAA